MEISCAAAPARHTRCRKEGKRRDTAHYHTAPSPEKMICRNLLLIILNSCPCAAIFVVNVAQSSYEAKENHNITLEWTFTTKPDCPQNNYNIFLERMRENKVVYQYSVHDGVEVSESQDEQFVGRIQSDIDVLKEGQIRLNVSSLKIKDSGDYTCKLWIDHCAGSGSCTLNVTSKCSFINQYI
ncbi:hypothetical protein CRENBAI_006987 [Crenichthys baileyi]|uniref:Immunoglobulin V-set domain-containing protein n=1 Tax=Crenichthys baileyi TaxID=28760 RepID=A0AAV9RU08_9TELE